MRITYIFTFLFTVEHGLHNWINVQSIVHSNKTSGNQTVTRLSTTTFIAILFCIKTLINQRQNTRSKKNFHENARFEHLK